MLAAPLFALTLPHSETACGQAVWKWAGRVSGQWFAIGVASIRLACLPADWQALQATLSCCDRGPDCCFASIRVVCLLTGRLRAPCGLGTVAVLRCHPDCCFAPTTDCSVLPYWQASRALRAGCRRGAPASSGLSLRVNPSCLPAYWQASQSGLSMLQNLASVAGVWSTSTAGAACSGAAL